MFMNTKFHSDNFSINQVACNNLRWEADTFKYFMPNVLWGMSLTNFIRITLELAKLVQATLHEEEKYSSISWY